MFERFSDEARELMALANQEAQYLHHEYMGTEHILLALTKNDDLVGSKILRDYKIDPKKNRN